MDPVSRSSTPGSDATVRPPATRTNSGPYRNNIFAESSGSNKTLLPGMVPPQREQHRPDTSKRSSDLCVHSLLTNLDTTSTVSTVESHNKDAYPEKPSVSDLVASSFLLVSSAEAITVAQARDDPTRQLSRPTSMSSLRLRPIEQDASPQIDENARQQPRQSRVHIRQRLGIRL